jgi:hypothetical protein
LAYCEELSTSLSRVQKNGEMTICRVVWWLSINTHTLELQWL